MGDRRGACKVLVGRPKGKRTLGRPRHRWKDDIKIDLQEMGWEGVDWIGVAEDRDRQGAAVLKLRVP
jgi:hypothetical protein